MPRFLPLFTLLLAAALLRFSDLPGRVMHTDEAVHAVTTGKLLAGLPFEYDPSDFHGPTLHYSTLPVAWLRQQNGFSQLDESTLRGTTAGYGVLLVFLTFLFRRELGHRATWLGAWLVALSPMMVFFSRYYIMEMLFAVYLTVFAWCFWRWTRGGGWGHATGAGLTLGLMHATKETFVIHLAALAGAALWIHGRNALPRNWTRARITQILAMAALGFLVSAALLSHGFQRPAAIIDGLRTYLLYFQRAEGADNGHAQPWHYYFSSLFGVKPAGGFLHSEIGILLLGAAGAIRAFWNRNATDSGFTRLLAAYTLLCAAAYSVIPYKTPWSFLGVTHGLLLLAATFLAALIPEHSRTAHAADGMPASPAARPRWPALAGVVLLALTSAHALLYNRRIIVTHPADPIQPMVYGHTCQEILGLAGEITRLEQSEGRKLSFVAAESENGWPLPWYRRNALGHNKYGKSLPAWDESPDVVAADTRALSGGLSGLRQTHVRRSYWLRPGVRLHVFFRKSLAGMPSTTAPTLGPARSP